MKFYTNVEQAGNRLLVRGYENGNRYSVKVPFNPTLYLPQRTIQNGALLKVTVWNHISLDPSQKHEIL